MDQIEAAADAIEFVVEERPDGSYSAWALGACILTEADTLDELVQGLREALCCHFDDGCQPRTARLRFVRVVREETWDL